MRCPRTQSADHAKYFVAGITLPEVLRLVKRSPVTPNILRPQGDHVAESPATAANVMPNQNIIAIMFTLP
jgi:hypothetical protein